MKFLINIVVLGLAIGSLLSCGNAAEAVKSPSVKGKIENAAGIQIFFDKVGLDKSSEILAKTEIEKDGSFMLPVENGFNPGLYRIRIGAKRVAFPLTGEEKKIEIKADLNTIDQAGVELKGSEAANQYMDIYKQYINTTVDLSKLKSSLASVDNSLVRLMLATQLLGSYNEASMEVHKEVYDKLAKDYPELSDTKTYSQVLLAAQQKIAASKRSGKVALGSPAPDIVLEDPEGQVRKLSDLKGNIVLLDFWASWCGPCRRTNPHLVETYNKYKDKGFTVYSVSLDGINPRILPRLTTEEAKQQQLDAAKKKWVAAIQKDNLSWDSHVSDLQHWSSPIAKMYGVSSIPRTFLIDREGNIAAINVKTPNLETELQKLL